MGCRVLNFVVEARRQTDQDKKVKRLKMAHAAEHFRDGGKRVAALGPC